MDITTSEHPSIVVTVAIPGEVPITIHIRYSAERLADGTVHAALPELLKDAFESYFAGQAWRAAN